MTGEDDETTGGEGNELRLITRLFGKEAASLLDWLADELARGEIAATRGGAERRVRPRGPLRVVVQADGQERGGRVRVDLEWESEERGTVDIQPV